MKHQSWPGWRSGPFFNSQHGSIVGWFFGYQTIWKPIIQRLVSRASSQYVHDMKICQVHIYKLYMFIYFDFCMFQTSCHHPTTTKIEKHIKQVLTNQSYTHKDVEIDMGDSLFSFLKLQGSWAKYVSRYHALWSSTQLSEYLAPRAMVRPKDNPPRKSPEYRPGYQKEVRKIKIKNTLVCGNPALVWREYFC